MELGTIIEHDFRVKVSDMSDIELHQEIAGQWNATRDFDEDEMNILIEELDRRTKAQEALDRMVAENQRLGLYDDAVNMTQECVDETAKCKHEWVGLTHLEMQELMAIRFIDDAVLATEAKLKEKNNG